MWIFAILNLLKFVLIVVGLIVLGAVLIRAKKKRREQMGEAIHQLFETKDNNTGSDT